jgi:DNA-binding transcriptional MerR regulator
VAVAPIWACSAVASRGDRAFARLQLSSNEIINLVTTNNLSKQIDSSLFIRHIPCRKGSAELKRHASDRAAAQMDVATRPRFLKATLIVNIRELTNATGLAERQVRYMVAEGFIPGPTGGRAHAQYGEEHLQAIQRYQRLKVLGFPPAAIRRLLQASAGAPFPIAPGITLLVNPDLIGRPQDTEALTAEVARTLTSIFPKEGR